MTPTAIVRVHRAAVALPLAAPPDERPRLDAHFTSVLRSLRMSPPPRLSPAQQRARALHLERLDAYRRRGRFPRNRRFPGQRLPHFIDDAGTRCAMGHLIELGGARNLVQHIARERNYARVRELADTPELVRWLEENGLTPAEAARIQPEYCGPPAQNCLCGNGIAGGYVEGTLGDGGSSLTVTAVYGQVRGVARNDVLLAEDNYGVGTAYDVVFASLGGDGKTAFIAFGSKSGQIAIPKTACWFPQVASIPGPLPLLTVEQALSSGTAAACEKVLTDHDAAWGRIQGGSQCVGVPDASVPSTSGDAGVQAKPAHDDGGCAVSTHAAGQPLIGIALSAAWLLHRVRRVERRREGR